MIDFFRRHLGAKLFLSYLAVILVGAVVLGLATRFTIPEAFNRHMGSGMGQGMMQGNATGRGLVSELFINFQASFNEALFLALLAAGAVAMLVSPRCGFTTGTNVVVDGGITKRIQY